MDPLKNTRTALRTYYLIHPMGFLRAVLLRVLRWPRGKELRDHEKFYLSLVTRALTYGKGKDKHPFRWGR